jgi:Ca-activated chloride channel family protein
MNFESPHLLFLLVVPLLSAIAAARHRGVQVAAPVASRAVRKRPRLAGLLLLPNLIPAGLLAVLVVLLAGPIRLAQSTGRVPKEVTNIQFCLNVSNTMLAQRIGMHCRYCAAARAMGEFARGREGDAFGLTLFGSIPILWVPLSQDVSAIYRAAQLCYPDHLPDSVSDHPDTAAGLRESVEQLAQRGKGRGGRLLILLTDGEDPAIGRHADKLAELMNHEDVTLHVLLFQNPGSAPTLAALAQRTENGRLFDCACSQQLDEVFRTIDAMKKIEYEVSSPQELPDARPWVAAAVALSVLYLLSLFGVRYTPW